MKRSAANRGQGFTLLEVLIATVIMGTVFVAIVGVLSRSLTNIERMKPQRLALQHARETMKETLVQESFLPGTTTGRWADGYRWQVQVETAGPGDSAAQGSQPAPPGTFTLFRIRTEIQWGSNEAPETYEIETLQWSRVSPDARD